ncbi:hypothetical protein QCA50_009584 [Cerrena zonata]|uniref:Polysaccharide lyase 14 domain-containing protein n=1 Tax=Cerrena zonata TaxID=2478898 RepID=A0AAW0GA75_9APHY
MLTLTFVASVLTYAHLSLCAFATAESIAQQYSLTTSTSIPFPTATLSNTDAQSFIVSQWSLSKGKIEDGASNVEFVNDPFPNNPAPGSTGSASNGTVLQVTYPQGTFSSSTGGAQLYSLWNTSDGSQFHSMLLTYEVAFDTNFQFVKGGKLPGLRGGPEPDGCSGGSAANGSNCFSTRLMWRKQGEGEVYAYILTPNKICDNSDFKCNSDGFGTSIQRGAFSFVPGQWNRVSMLVRLNEPTDTANGQVAMWYNNVDAIDQQALAYRQSEAINVGGLYLSTFFGGNDDSWASPQTVHSYFRNFELWGSSSSSNLTGAKISSASPAAASTEFRSLLAFTLGVGCVLLFGAGLH